MSPQQAHPTSGCVLCGKCLEVCPLLAATGREELSPRAKAHLVAVLERNPDALSEQDITKLAELCLGCGRCTEVCSQGVNVPEAVSRLREAHPGWKGWLWKQWMKRSASLWPIAGNMAGKMHAGVAGPLANAGPEHLSGLLKMASCLGRKPIAPFLSLRSMPSLPFSEALLFCGCAAQGAAPYWTSAAQSLCSSLNISLIEAEFACCGSGLQSAGLCEQRRAAVQRNVDIWRAGDRPRIITLCASCHAGLAGIADDEAVFPDQNEAAAWTTALTPLSSLLLPLLNSGRFVVSPNAPQVIAYHRPCHIRGDDSDRALVQAMLEGQDETRKLDISESCCGFGGVMQLKARGLSQQVSANCWETLDPAPGTLVLTGCTACVFQLAATAPQAVEVAHWLECLNMT